MAPDLCGRVLYVFTHLDKLLVSPPSPFELRALALALARTWMLMIICIGYVDL